VLGWDDTLARRRGATIQAQGIDRDPVRASHRAVVNASGLRWVRLRRLGPMTWATRVGALPCLTGRAPCERSQQERGQRHQKLTDWARHRRLVGRRWVPERPLVLVTDRRVAVRTRWWRLRQWPTPSCGVTRVRLEAARYAPAPPRPPRPTGRPRLQGQRVPPVVHVRHETPTGWRTVTGRGGSGEPARVVESTAATAVWSHAGMPPLPIRWGLVRDPHGEFDPQALLGTDVMADPVQLLAWCVRRWRLEVTWQEARAHVGLETQRPWQAQAMARTTPALLGLCSLVTLMAGQLAQEHARPVRQAAWSRTSRPTFVDAIALVRQHVWTLTHGSMSPATSDRVDIPGTRLNRLTETLGDAA